MNRKLRTLSSLATAAVLGLSCTGDAQTTLAAWHTFNPETAGGVAINQQVALTGVTGTLTPSMLTQDTWSSTDGTYGTFSSGATGGASGGLRSRVADGGTNDVTITNCVLRSHCTAIKFGTESTGGFRNITITNCTIQSPSGDKPFFGYKEGRCGIALEIVDGGTLENVIISNIVIDGAAIPFCMRLGNRARLHTKDAPKPGIGSFRNVVLSNLIATGAGPVGCAIAGLPDHPIENVTLRDLRLEFAGGGTTEDANREIPEREDAYPEGDMFGTLPAFGIYARHVRNLQMHNVQVVTNTPDERPETLLDDVV